MATSFNGIAFGLLTQDFRPIPLSRELFINEWHVPYSNTNGVDIGGLGATHVRASVRVAYGVMSSYLAWLGQSYTLIINDVNYGAATLIKVENMRYDPKAIYGLFDAEWVLAS